MKSYKKSDTSPCAVSRRSEHVKRPLGPMGAQLEFTRIQHRDRYYEVLPGAPPDYPAVAVRIFRAEVDGALVVELNGHLVTMTRAVFEEGPQHPDFRREAEKVGIRMLPLQHRYWFDLMPGLKDDMDLRFGPNWQAIGGSHACRNDQWWELVEARERHLDREILAGRIPEPVWADILQRLAIGSRTHYEVAAAMRLAIEGKSALFDTRNAGRPN